MKVKDLARTVRPLFFENGCYDYEYSSTGSCVLIRYRNRYYAITALHNNNKNIYKPCQFMVPYFTGSEFFLPMKEVFHVDTSENYDTDHKDIFFIEIPYNEMNKENIEVDTVFDFEKNANLVHSTRTKYLVHGFPNEIQHIDYEKKTIKNQRFSASAKLLKKEIYLGIDQIKFDVEPGLKSFSGMSGGGVFSITPDEKGGCYAKFEGILLRGTTESLLGYMLNSATIKTYLDESMQLV